LAVDCAGDGAFVFMSVAEVVVFELLESIVDDMIL